MADIDVTRITLVEIRDLEERKETGIEQLPEDTCIAVQGPKESRPTRFKVSAITKDTKEYKDAAVAAAESSAESADQSAGYAAQAGEYAEAARNSAVEAAASADASAKSAESSAESASEASASATEAEETAVRAEEYVRKALSDVVAVSLDQTTGDLIAHSDGDFSAFDSAYIDYHNGDLVLSFDY